MSCCSFIFITFGALAAIAFLIAANVGTIRYQSVRSSIFLLKLSLQDISIPHLTPSLATHTISELGFAQSYIFGMYGFCRGTSTGTTTIDNIWQDIHFTADNCTDTSLNYSFNPVEFMIQQINDHNKLGITINQEDIILPGELNKYLNVSSNVSRVIYIASIIAIGLQAIALLFEWFCCIVGGGAVTATFQFLACAAAFISSGSATGQFVFIRNEFNKQFSTFGIKAMISTNFLVLTWIGTGFTLFTLVFMLLSNCCYTRTTLPRVYERVVI